MIRWLTLVGLVGQVWSSLNAEPNADLKNVCLNGKDPSKMDERTYMTTFAQGPCSPLVLLPGVLASILRVEINDCAAFQAADPATFTACGWNTCAGGPNSPLKEYQMWVPNVDSPMTIVSGNELNKDCFAGLIEVVFDTEGGKFVPIQKPGITLSVTGYTPETITTSQCGTKALEDFINDIPNPEMTEYFKLMIQRLDLMGYRSGLTMQAVPYDFRLSSGFDQASKNLPGIIKGLFQFTNKKVVIAAHSMGNMKAAFGLWNMPQADKDNFIQMYLAIAPPWSGATKPISYTTCGSNEFSFPFHLGIDMKTWKALAGTFPAIYELLPELTYSTQINTPWMQKIMARIAYEAGQSSDPVFDWLPNKSQTCYTNFTKKACISGLENYNNYASYKGLPITNENVYDWVANYSFSQWSRQMYTLFDSRFDSLPNINVPLAVVYSTVVPTEGRFDFKQDPRITADQNKFCTNKEQTWTNWLGDETVPSTSAVTGPIKWSMDFQNQVAGAKPVKLVEVCSALNIRNTPYDTTSSGGVKQMNKLEYQGLSCDCSEGKYRHCTHISMLYNPALVEYLTASLVTGDVQPVSDMVNKMSNVQLAEYYLNCKLISQVYASSSN